MGGDGLTTREPEHLAVLRVSAMAHDLATEKIHVRLTDVRVLLSAVDRLAAGADGRPEVVSLSEGDPATTLFAGIIFISGGVHTTAPGRGPAGGSAADRMEGLPS